MSNLHFKKMSKEVSDALVKKSVACKECDDLVFGIKMQLISQYGFSLRMADDFIFNSQNGMMEENMDKEESGNE